MNALLDFIYLAVPFLVFAINIFLAFLVIRGEWRSFRHQVFAGFLAGMALWGFTIFGMRSSPNLDIAFIWERFGVFPSIVFSSVLFYHFALVFSDNTRSRTMLRLFYLLGAAVTVLSFAGFVATDMHLRWYGYAPTLGPAFLVYLLGAYLPIGFAYRVLFQRLRGLENPQERTRTWYVIAGITMSLIGGTTDFLPPLLGVRIYPMGVVMNIGFGLTTTIAVTRYHLLDLRVLLRRGFAYSLISTSIFAVYGVIFLLFTLVFSQRNLTANVFATIAALLVAAIALPPLIGRIQTFVDRLFFRERYDHLMAMQEFTASTRDIADFSGLADSLVLTVQHALQADWAAALIPDSSDERFVAAGSAATAAHSLNIAKDSWVASWLQRHDDVLTPQLIEYDPYLQAMAQSERTSLLDSGVQLLVPLKSAGKLTGLLALGPRIVEQAYSPSDIRTLTTVASQTATMIENSRLYSQEMSRLRELERLDSLKSNLLRTVSHELKSPITAVKTAVDLLSLSEGELNERAKGRLMRTLQNGVDRLERLVGESLEYAQMRSSEQKARREPTNIPDLLEQVVALMGPNISAKNQKFTIEIEPDMPEILADPDQIERVLLNLVNNANKFTPVDGSIAVSIKREGDLIVTTIKDNGRGIPEQDHPNIFGEYFRGSNADGLEGAGTGLGLAIAKSLVDLHGGQITFESAVGVGTTFRVALPLPMVHVGNDEPQATQQLH